MGTMLYNCTIRMYPLRFLRNYHVAFSFQSKQVCASTRQTYSVPFIRRMRNCSGERIALHSSSDFFTGPDDAMATVTLLFGWFKTRPNRAAGRNPDPDGGGLQKERYTVWWKDLIGALVVGAALG
jgi:hypothetical protein